MVSRILAFSGILGVASAISLLTPPPAAAGQGAGRGSAAEQSVARTPDGHPDLQGIWVNNSVTPLERPKALDGKRFLTDEEVAQLKRNADRLFDVNGSSDLAAGDDVFLAALANPEKFTNPNATGSPVAMIERVFDNRTSLIVDPPDGRIPPLTHEAQLARARTTPRLPEGPEELSNPNRCITFGVPRLGGNAASYNPYYQIVQTPTFVVFAGETIHDARIIPTDGRPHLSNTLRLWHGDSRGRWERDTLVVETTNFSPMSSFMGSGEHFHLVERFTRVGFDRIDYQITISDPTIWTRSWTAVIHLTRTGNRMYEYACHEGNEHTMSGIMGAARTAEKDAAAGAKR